MRKSVLIVTDAWEPQLNGVVICLKALRDQLKARGSKVEFLTPNGFPTLPMPTYHEVGLALTRTSRIAQIIDRVAPDHIHIATEGPLGWHARRYCLRQNLDFTTSYHTDFPQYFEARAGFTRSIVAGYLRWFHSRSKGVLVATPSVYAQLQSMGYERLRQWTRGVDSARFHPGEKTWFRDLPGPRMLCVGRVAIEKNLRAFLDLDVPGSKIVVGDGPQLEELRRSYPRVAFLGRRVGAELAAIYRSADLFVFPSRTDTFGNVMLEAMASGLPVAAYPVTGPIDVLTDPLSGAMDENLAVAVDRALSLSPAAAVQHAGRFTWSACADIFEANLIPLKPVPPVGTLSTREEGVGVSDARPSAY
jgi:glycosyltransferase involved in cell wall biosynthesis